MEKMNLKKNSLILAALVVFGIFTFSNITLADSNCATSIMTATEAQTFKDAGLVGATVSISGTTASAVFTNNTNCTMPVDVKSYKMYDQNVYSQVFFADAVANIAPNSTQTVVVNIPSCMAQVDAYFGTGPTNMNDWTPNARLLGFGFSQNNGSGFADASGNFCTNTVNTPTLVAACSVNPGSANIGDTVNWSATGVTGGTGSYTYAWTGDEGLTGNSTSITKSYSTAGTKIGTLTVTSGSQTVVRSCSTTINQIAVTNNLTVSCSANNSSNNYIAWSANASGGTNSNYNYSWTGTDGLNGNSAYISQYYNNYGTKTGYVTVTSGGQSASASCSGSTYNNNNSSLYASCYANPTNPQVGQTMNWYVTVSGGNNYNNNYYNNNYSYSWYGTDTLNSSSQSPSMTYYNGGSKTATVQVYANGQSVSATCYANVNQNSVLAFSQANPTPLASAVYLSQVPYTGLADNLNLMWFILGLVLFSAYIAYVVIAHKKSVGELN